MKKILIWVDLETYDTIPTAKVIAIALRSIIYDMDKDLVADTRDFYVAGIDPYRGLNSTRTSSASTLKWWDGIKETHPSAWDAVKAMDKDLGETIKELSVFIEDIIKEHNLSTSDVIMFGNGPEFDLSILTSVYEAAGLVVPWAFWNQHSSRTMSLCMELLGLPKLSAMLPYSDGLHTAIYDADMAAKRAMLAINVLKELKPHAKEVYLNYRLKEGVNT